MTAPGRNRLRDAYCVTFFGDWEEPSGESRVNRAPCCGFPTSPTGRSAPPLRGRVGDHRGGPFGRPGRSQRRRQVDPAGPHRGPLRSRWRHPQNRRPRAARRGAPKRAQRPGMFTATSCSAPIPSAPPCWPRPKPAHDPARIAEIHIRLADIAAETAPARAATILAGLGIDEAAQSPPAGHLLRRLADARRHCRTAVFRARPAAPRRAQQPSRPRGPALARGLSCRLSRHGAPGQPRPHAAQCGGRLHPPSRRRPPGRLWRQLRQLRKGAQPAARPGRRPIPPPAGSAQAHAGLCRPLPLQGEQGAPGSNPGSRRSSASARSSRCTPTPTWVLEFPCPPTCPRR